MNNLNDTTNGENLEVNNTNNETANENVAAETGIHIENEMEKKIEEPLKTEVLSSIEETPVAEETPIAEETPVAEETTVVEETPVVEALAAPNKPETENKEDHDFMEETEEVSEINLKSSADYQEMSLTELVNDFEKLSKESNFDAVKSNLFALRNEINTRFDADRDAQFKDFTQDGNDNTSFVYAAPPLYNKFREIGQKINERRAKVRQELESQRKKNLQIKNEILEKLKNIVENIEADKGYKEFTELQTLWRSTGPVPTEMNEGLWETYHVYVEAFYNNLRAHRELREMDFQKNLAAKISLCEQVEDMLIKEPDQETINALNFLHEKWREIGPVSRDKSEEVWTRFKGASDKIYDKRRGFVLQQDQDRQKNYESKIALCEKAEALLEEPTETLNQFNTVSESYIDLQKLWKSIGNAPREVNDEIWTRFRTSCDAFFTKKAEFYRVMRDQESNNLTLKLDLIMQAEAVKDSDQWKATSETLIKLQKEWKSIGPVARRDSAKIWDRFRAACDHFFNKKAEFFNTLDERQEENQKRKEMLIEKISSFNVSGDYEADLEHLKAYQSEWMDIGFAPMKEKERLNTAYRNAINGLFDKLKLNKTEQRQLQFETKLDAIKNSKDADKFLKNEETSVLNQMTHVRNEMAILENNIGFFANSKNADALKKEIEQKINKYKDELSNLKMQLDTLKKESQV